MNKEEIFIPKGLPGDEPNLFVSVNGVNYLLPRGKTSLVPEVVAQVIRRSQKAQELLDARVERLTKK